MPAEWAPHRAVWTAWPYLLDQWAEGLDAPRTALAAMCSAIVDLDATGRSRGEVVELLVRGPDEEADARARLGAAAAHVRFHRAAYGDIWLRDTGPLFLTHGATDRAQASSAASMRPRRDAMAACFRFDGWGGKYVMAGDTGVSEFVAVNANTPRTRFEFVLEGGAVEVDGAGTIMTTKQCLLGGARNPGLTQADLDARLRYALGGDHVIWLDQGLLNDHTDGHIDTIARFVAPGVVACMEPADGDPNRDAMRAIIRDLRAAKSASGRPIEVVTVPSPGEVRDDSGMIMPASYMNFYIANTTVVVPTYEVPTDDAAVAAIAKMFPDRRTIGVPGKAVVVGGGGFHCSTQQEPL